jgi:hypothetical protein
VSRISDVGRSRLSRLAPPTHGGDAAEIERRRVGDAMVFALPSSAHSDFALREPPCTSRATHVVSWSHIVGLGSSLSLAGAQEWTIRKLSALVRATRELDCFLGAAAM